jgi:N-acetylglucosamine malate deacetylase 2
LTTVCIREDWLPTQDEVAGQVLHRLAKGTPIGLPAVVVAAHPDDETLGMGGRLPVLKHLTIVQLTDGAPRESCDADRLGFPTRLGYSSERAREFSRALEVLAVRCRRICHNAPDQESVFRLSELVRSVERDLRGARLVFTHPYEGGHPDHDTAALVVQMACARMSSRGEHPPARFEFASYHHQNSRMVTGEFWPDQNCPETSVELDHRAHAVKCRALAEYRTQSRVIEWFCTEIERYRAAPYYDFSQPPPPGLAQYDFFGWPITAARWLEVGASALPLLQETRP